MTRSLLALLLVAIGARTATAQTFSRADVMRRAALHPTTEAANSEADQARAQKRQADALRWPHVSLSLGVITSLRATLVPGTQSDSVETTFKLGDIEPGGTADLTIIQPLYTFGKIAERQRAADLGIAARTAQARMHQADVAVDGADLYEKFLLARDTQRFLEESDHMLVRSIEATEERFANHAPDVTQHDVLRLKTARAPLLVALHEANAGVERARAGLRAYFGVADNAPFDVADSRLAPIAVGNLTLPELIARAYADRPELVALTNGAASYEALANAEHAGYLPDIVALGVVSGAYTLNHDAVVSRYVYDPAHHFVPFAGIGLRWEVWGPGAGARADEEHARAAELRHLGEWARTALSADVTNAYEELERARADLPALDAGYASSKEWVVRANADYAVGMTDSITLRDAVEAYITTRFAQLEATYRFNVALAHLSRAIGAASGGVSLYAGGGQ